MDSLSVAKEKIYPHQVACLVLIFHSCKHDDSFVLTNEVVLTSQINKVKRQVILLLLDLIQVTKFIWLNTSHHERASLQSMACAHHRYFPQNFCTPGRFGCGNVDGSDQGVVVLNYHYL